jgi:hypothetical protein
MHGREKPRERVPVEHVEKAGGHLDQGRGDQNRHSSACDAMSDRANRREPELVRVDRPQLEQQQWDGGRSGRNMDALGQPVTPHWLGRNRQPPPRLVLIVAEQTRDEQDGDSDAEHQADPRRNGSRPECAAESRPQPRTLSQHGDSLPGMAARENRSGLRCRLPMADIGPTRDVSDPKASVIPRRSHRSLRCRRWALRRATAVATCSCPASTKRLPCPGC